MSQFVKIILGTPIWVWFLGSYMIFIGIKSAGARIVYLPKLFIIPAILTIIKSINLVSGEWLVYLCALSLGMLMGVLNECKVKIVVIKEKISIEIPGNYTTIALMLTFFATKYFFGYLHNTAPILAAQYASYEVALSGIFGGYFWGRALLFSYRFFNYS